MVNNDYSTQEEACKRVFGQEVNPAYVEDWHFHDHTQDITGLDAFTVVGRLKIIVNKKCYQDVTGKFYLKIALTPENLKVFKLEPRLTDDEPGNGFLSLNGQRPKFIDRGLLTDLKGSCNNKTSCLARHLKELFKDNKYIAQVDSCIAKVYMLLLFEIAKRLVYQQRSTEKKWKFDKLPIGSAIARIVTLLEAEECTFDDVFSEKGRFHCFSSEKEPKERKEAIKRINDAYQEYQSTRQLPLLSVTEEILKMFSKRWKP